VQKIKCFVEIVKSAGRARRAEMHAPTDTVRVAQAEAEQSRSLAD